MRTPRTLTTVAGLALVLALASCGAAGGTDSSEESSSGSTGASSGESEGGEAYQDTVETRRADLGAAALEEKLSVAAESGETLALDVLVQRAGSTIEEDVGRNDGEIAMSFVGEGDEAAYEIVGAPPRSSAERISASGPRCGARSPSRPPRPTTASPPTR